MRVHKSLILILVLCLSGLMAFSQADSILLNKLKAFNKSHPAEKTYLQFDNPYYAAGDTIYFKAYVTMGERHAPSQISGVLHVDLINTKNKIDQSIKLQLANGIAWGDFALPDSLPKGNYRVRAWTEWMRNDPGSFFERTIPIGSVQNNKVSESSTVKPINARCDEQFFPEGGTLVEGIKSRIAFKAVGTNGLGISTRGVVLDNNNKEVATFTSVHLGMGSFDLAPEPGKTYQAKLTFADGTTQTVQLPRTDGQGLALSVNNDSIPVAKVRIMTTSAYFAANKGRAYTLLIYSGGVATTVDCTLDSAITTLDILKRKLFTGIATITLFSPNNEPLCERLIFVQNYDQLALGVTTDKTEYTPREEVTLKLNAKTRADSAAVGHFSIAVTDESKVPNDENSETTILTDLLLTSDLKGYIEQPNYYFSGINNTTTKNLDLVMLTHGYRRFEWKEILKDSQMPVAYKPENDLSITGTVKTMLGKPVAKGTVSLISFYGGPILTQTTDDNGNFRFGPLFILDTARFMLNGATAKGKNMTQLTYTQEQQLGIAQGPFINAKPNPDSLLMSYLENSEKQREELSRLGLGKGRLLKEVKIKARKPPEYRSQSLVPMEAADQVIYGDQLPSGRPLALQLLGVAHGIQIRGQGIEALGPHRGPMKVLIDGMWGTLDQVRTDDVETIEILKPPTSYIYGEDGLGGVMVITTRPRASRISDIVSKGVLPITVIGFHKARQFYTPKYAHPNDSLNRKDLRSTIYWLPELATDKEGNASTSFYNADGKGYYRVIVEGIDEKGNIGRTIYRYKVE